MNSEPVPYFYGVKTFLISLLIICLFLFTTLIGLTFFKVFFPKSLDYSEIQNVEAVELQLLDLCWLKHGILVTFKDIETQEICEEHVYKRYARRRCDRDYSKINDYFYGFRQLRIKKRGWLTEILELEHWPFFGRLFYKDTEINKTFYSYNIEEGLYELHR